MKSRRRWWSSCRLRTFRSHSPPGRSAPNESRPSSNSLGGGYQAPRLAPHTFTGFGRSCGSSTWVLDDDELLSRRRRGPAWRGPRPRHRVPLPSAPSSLGFFTYSQNEKYLYTICLAKSTRGWHLIMINQWLAGYSVWSGQFNDAFKPTVYHRLTRCLPRCSRAKASLYRCYRSLLLGVVMLAPKILQCTSVATT